MSVPVDRTNGVRREMPPDPDLLAERPVLPQPAPPQPVAPPLVPIPPPPVAERTGEARTRGRPSRYRAPENVARSTGLGDPPRLWTERPADAISLLKKRPRARVNVALALVTDRGDCRAFAADQQPGIARLVRGGFQTLYEVDCGVHRFYATAKLPSAVDGFSFRAELHLTWQVVDPATVIRRQIHDIGRELLPHALHRMRPLSREYAMTGATRVENAINGYFRTQAELATAVRAGAAVRAGDEPFGLSFGVEVSTFVWLGLDSQRHDQVRVDDRIRHYRRIIERGDVEQFALRLARNPGDAADVVEMMRRWSTEERAATADFVAQLVDSGALDRWEVDDQVRQTLGWLRASTNRVLGLPDAHPGQSVPRRRVGDCPPGFAPFRSPGDRPTNGRDGTGR